MAQTRQARHRYRKKRQISKKTWIFSLSAAGVLMVALVLLLTLPAELIVAEEGEMAFGYDASGIVIRSEKLYKAEDYGKTVYIAEEGQAVSAGSEIAYVYSGGYNEADMLSLQKLQNTIMDYQENNVLRDIQNQDLENLNQSIAAKSEEISQVVAGEEEGELLRLERELQALMSERAKYLRDTAQADDQLNAYYEEEAALETRIEDWKKTILAEADGLVSFYFDGTETLLTPSNMTKLTTQNIEDILGGKSFYKQDTATATNPLYRLVDQNLWYVVFMTEERVPEFENNTAFKVRFFEGDDDVYVGNVIDCVQDGSNYLYYFEFNQPVDKLLTVRQVNAEITADYVGIKVPMSAIVEEEGVKGVYYQDGEKKVFEPITVLIQEGDMAIIQPVDLKSNLKAGSMVYS